MLLPPEEFRDSHSYQEYNLASYRDQQGPPLTKRTSLVIAAVVHNQVDVLRDLLAEPTWYDVSDVSGYSLLHIAILRLNVEVFDFMMSMPNFPLEFVDRSGKTALMTTIHGYVNDTFQSEHFACELITNGANIPRKCCSRSTPLQCCLVRLYFRASKLLMERGVDVNMPHADGYTPLEYNLAENAKNVEMSLALLMYGAEPSVILFENSVLHNRSEILAETLFFLLFDEYSTDKLQLHVLIRLAEQRSLLFDASLRFSVPLRFVANRGYSYFCYLCSIDAHYLKQLINKYTTVLSEALFSVNLMKREISFWYKPLFLENVVILFESDLRPAMLFLLSHMSRFVSFCFFEHIALHQETDVEKLYLFFLSYGLHVTTTDVEFAYRLPPRRYNKFFKILLHMDLRPHNLHYNNRIIDAMPALIVNVNMELETFLQNPEPYIYMEDLFDFFRHPRLTEIYNDQNKLSGTEDEVRLPQIPLLLELARNAFRRFFINKFNITSFKEFDSHLQPLDMSSEYKKIISYEIPLYC